MVKSHARLCLFGDRLRHVSALEHCLKVDDELRDTLLGLLHRLGTILIRGMIRYPLLLTMSFPMFRGF